jgi:hypothetical protein
MNIYITEPPTEFTKVIYQGAYSRIPSMTDVRWLSDTRLVAAHRYAGKVYLIDLSDKGYSIISTYKHTYKNKLYQTEAFEINKEKNIIYLISYTEMLFILDILPNNSIICSKAIQLNTQSIPYHGIRLYDRHIFVTPSNKNIGYETIKKMNTETYAIEDIPSLGNTIRVKHIQFLPNGTVFLIINYKTATTLTMKNHISNGCLRLYTSDFTVILNSFEMPSTHLDGLTMDKNIFYITCRNLDNGYILKGNITDNMIITEKRIPCEDFPHGIDIFNNKIAYTSYTTSGIHIIKTD